MLAHLPSTKYLFFIWEFKMSNLIKYDAARYALEQAVSVDEVKDIRDKAQAMAAYAKQAKDTKLVEWATEIKVRAERKAGQMLAELNLKPGPKIIGSTLLPIDVSKTQSSRWQKLASVPDEQFEQAVSAAKEVAGEVTTAAMLRIERAQNSKPVKPEQPAPLLENEKKLSTGSSLNSANSEELYNPADHELQEAKDAINDLAEQNAALRYKLGASILDATEEEKQIIYDEMIELNFRIRALEAEVYAITTMRDALMRENAQMKKQILSQAGLIKKLGGNSNVKAA